MTNQQPSGFPQSVASKAAPASMGGNSTGSSRPNRATGHSDGLPQQSVGSQLPQGISIGVQPAAQMHFHYNHVDNRQLHISNNAPKNVVTNNNQRYNTDNSNHHNTHAPQANTYNTTATNVGNTHTNVSQKATTFRQSSGPSSNGRPPSESMAIRDKQYKTVKQVSFNEWTDRRKVTYKEVPDDRPC
ncbi:hypothetical protein SLS63_007296 [Diaporthe eres]|uniref:Uncharacterized protein n=1 Tax=Diaporthe eres TaxID=83184 RepID=A0ABR1P661_DIAER